MQYILPWSIHLAMGNRKLRAYLECEVTAARRAVLEINIGSGRDFPYHGADTERIIGLDPSAQQLDMARKASRDLDIEVRLPEGSAKTILLEDNSVDTVVTTWMLCSIPDASKALANALQLRAAPLGQRGNGA